MLSVVEVRRNALGEVVNSRGGLERACHIVTGELVLLERLDQRSRSLLAKIADARGVVGLNHGPNVAIKHSLEGAYVLAEKQVFTSTPEDESVTHVAEW